MATPQNAVGKITQVIGAVVDVQFEGDLPAILSAPETKNGDNRRVPDGAQHPGKSSVSTTEMHVTEEGFRELAQRSRALGPRVAAVLEGGYELDTLPWLVQAALDGFG